MGGEAEGRGLNDGKGKTRLCFKCNQPGGIAANCRSWPATGVDHDAGEGMQGDFTVRRRVSSGGVWVMGVDVQNPGSDDCDDHDNVYSRPEPLPSVTSEMARGASGGMFSGQLRRKVETDGMDLGAGRGRWERVAVPRHTTLRRAIGGAVIGCRAEAWQPRVRDRRDGGRTSEGSRSEAWYKGWRRDGVGGGGDRVVGGTRASARSRKALEG